MPGEGWGCLAGSAPRPGRARHRDSELEPRHGRPALRVAWEEHPREQSLGCAATAEALGSASGKHGVHPQSQGDCAPRRVRVTSQEGGAGPGPRTRSAGAPPCVHTSRGCSALRGGPFGEGVLAGSLCQDLQTSHGSRDGALAGAPASSHGDEDAEERGVGPLPRMQPPPSTPHFSLGNANPACPSTLAGGGWPHGPQRPHLQVTWLILLRGLRGPRGSAEPGPGGRQGRSPSIPSS